MRIARGLMCFVLGIICGVKYFVAGDGVLFLLAIAFLFLCSTNMEMEER
jgi:hypothetical protein